MADSLSSTYIQQLLSSYMEWPHGAATWSGHMEQSHGAATARHDIPEKMAMGVLMSFKM